MTDPMPGALVAGWSAHVVDKLLARYLPPFLPLMAPEDRAELQRTAAAVHAASRLYEERRSAAIGSPETGSAEIGAGSEASVMVTVSTAALLAGVTERRLRQMAARWESEGLAHKVGRAWLIDRTTVELYREQRRRAA